MKTRVTLLSILLLCLCQTLSGRDTTGVWYGKVTAVAGTDFQNSDVDLFTEEPFQHFSHIMGNGKFQLGYKNSKFRIQGDLGAKSAYRRSSKESLSGTVTETDSVLNGSYDYTQTLKNNAEYETSITASIFARASDRIDIKYSQLFFFDEPTTSFIGVAWSDVAKAKASEEKSENKKFSCNPYVDWFHKFDRNRNLDLKAGWNFVNDRRHTIWRIGTTDNLEEEMNIRTYRLTPKYVDSDFYFTGTFTNLSFAHVRNLDMTFRLNAKLKQDMDDYSAANLAGEIWLDSVSFRESFRYYALTVEPEVRALYRIGKFDFDFSIKPQYYSDKLDDSQHTERFDKGSISPILKLGGFWNINDSHRIGFTFFRDITRPDYLQMCWFRRPGSYANELQVGNPYLLPTTTARTLLEYRFKYGRFTSNLELGYKYVDNIIEKTFHKEFIDDTEFRIITWINAGYSYNSTAKLTLGWQGKSLKGSINGNYNYFVGVDNNNKEKRSGDYSINADLQYNWKWDFCFLARFRYQSKIIRNYTSMTEYVGLDIKVSKKLFKKLELYAEGVDLFDKPIQTLTESADHLTGQMVTNKLTRRLFNFGITFSF